MSTPKEGGAGVSRTTMFIAAVLVGLGSGSNYVYSGYAPQLAAKLGITSTEANLVGIGGNLGVYLTGPIWGIFVDSQGPRWPLFLASILSFIGYTVVRLFYLGVFPIRYGDDGPAAAPLLLFLILAMFCTGAAGSAGLSSAMNAVAKSFPDRTRASATGTVLAGFGLSAFFFSMLGQVFYKGEAGGLLLLLAIGTSLPHLVGSFVIYAQPPDQDEYDEVAVHDGDEDLDDATECALAREAALTVEGHVAIGGSRRASDDLEHARSHSRELDRGRQGSSDPLLSRPRHPRSDSLASLPPTALHFTPWDAFGMTDFRILLVILALLCGTGLMWINNVGAVTLALARDGWTYDQRKVSVLQASQVSTISVFNCAGRILGGALSDLGKLRFGLKRIWFLPIVAVMFLATQGAVIHTTNVQHLWLVSAALGLAYGCLFNVVPMLVLEWFGMTHFSSNWGWISVAPVVGGNLFNVFFGRVYDSNTVGRIGGPPQPPNSESESLAAITRALAAVVEPSDGKNACLIGSACYAAAFRISATGCVLALALSILTGIRRERQSTERKRQIRLQRAERSDRTVASDGL